MGERCNIKIVEPWEGEIYFFSHWKGENLIVDLHRALTRGKDRWYDPEYLNRIIFCDVVRNDEQGLTGYGLSTYLMDSDYPLLTVNHKTQTVEIGEGGAAALKYSFEDFVNLPVASLPAKVLSLKYDV